MERRDEAGDDDPFMSREEDKGVERSLQGQAQGRAPGQTQGQGQREENDEDDASESPQNPDTNTPRSRTNSRGRNKRHKGGQGEVMGVFDTLAKALECPLPPGHDTLQKALFDLKEHYQTRLTAVQRYKIVKRLQEDTSAPMIWLSTDDEVKELVIEEWLA